MAAAVSSSANSRPTESASISVISSPTTAAFASSLGGRRASSSTTVSRVHSIITAAIWRAMSETTMTALPIPQIDPRAGYFEQKAEIDAAIARVLASGQYILGREVEAFEAAFAAWLGVGHAIGVGSGTDAIELALRACGIGQGSKTGDLVFTVSHTAVATVAAIERAGAVPVLIDIEPGGFTM